MICCSVSDQLQDRRIYVLPLAETGRAERRQSPDPCFPPGERQGDVGILDCRLQIADCRLQIADLYICVQSAIKNRQSKIGNRKSKIANTDSD